MKRKRGRPRVPVAPQKVREMHQSGMSYRKIAQVLNISKSTAQLLGATGDREGTQNINQPSAIDSRIFWTGSPAILEV